MDRRRLYVMRLIVALLFILFVLFLNVVKAEIDDTRDHRSDHKLILDIADEYDVGISDEHDGSAHMDLINQISIDSEESETQNINNNDLYADDVYQFEELFVEDDMALDLEPLYAGEEDYDETFRPTIVPEFDELPHCPAGPQGKNEDRPKPSVVVSTLDGRVTGLDASSGAVLWTHQTGGRNNEMLSSSMSKLEVTSRGEWVRLIPSLDGGIYRCDGDVVEALPVTAETLLHSSFKFNADTIFTGGKSTEVWGMALDTGNLLYVCNSSGCKRQRTASKPAHLLVVKRVTQTVRAIDPKSGDERWNFSVGQHEVNVAGGGCDSMEYLNYSLEDLPVLHFVVPEGIVMGMDSDNQLLWQQKLASPVVNAWKVTNGLLEPIDLFSTSSIPALTPDHNAPDSHYRSQDRDEPQQPALYVGVHQKQLYIQQSGGMRSQVNSAYKIFTSGAVEEGEGSEVSFPRVQWRPYLATALSRTPVINHNENKYPLIGDKEEITAVAIPQQIDYPYDNGYYLFADEGKGKLNYSGPWKAPILEEDTIMDDVASHIVRICFQIGPDTWVKMFCGVLMYTMLHYFVLRWVLKQMQQRITNQALHFISMALHHIILNNPHIIAIIQRMGVQLPQLPEPPAPQKNEEEDIPAINNGGDDLHRNDSTSQFTSRYHTDFVPIQCLGRGGFGVVFQVYNKLDENEYAVKRITLPSKEASAERVKREVRALAKLNHTNIVRYYNSWLESPPLGWHDETEMQWKCGDTLSNTVFSREESAYKDSVCERDNKHVKDGSNDSLEEVLRKFNVPNVSDYSNVYSSRSEVDSLDRYEDEESETSFDSDKEYCGEELEDTSIDIIFENSVSKTDRSTNPIEKEDSFEILFEHSNSLSEACDKNSPTFLHREKPGILSSENDCDLVENSESVSFIEPTYKSQKRIFVHSTEDSTSAYSSHINFDQNEISQDCCDGDRNVRRRRVRSHPVQDVQAKDERPRTLSLGTTAEDTASKIRQEVLLPRSKSFLYIQMELCHKESLKDWLLKNMLRQEKNVYNMFNDIVRAVEYVHDNQLMHRDLKPSNIFFSLDGEIKIGDFGLVTTITEGEQEIRTPADNNSILAANSRHTHKVGTHLYMSPEQINNQVYDYKVDIYSLGLIFFEMLVPFVTGMERLQVMSNLRDGHFPEGFCDNYPDETELLKLMLSTNPSNRPTTRGIRVRNPLRPLQGSAVNDISPDEHFRLNRQRSHTRSHSGSSFSFVSTSSST